MVHPSLWLISLLLGAVTAAHAEDSMRALAPLAQRGAKIEPLGDTFYECRLRSICLGQERAFVLHLPGDYHAARPGGWPLILFLHGAGRDQRTLLNDPQTRAALDRSPAIVLLPSGGGSWWIDSEAKPDSRFQQYLLELMDTVCACLPIAPEASRHAVGGWSMGGFGAANLAADHPERFGALAGLIALLDFPNPTYPAAENHAVPPVLADQSMWPAHNPLCKVDRLRGKHLFFLTAENAFDRRMNEAFHQRLNTLGIQHEFILTKGAHDWRTVAANFPRLLAFLEQSVSGDTAGSSPSNRE